MEPVPDKVQCRGIKAEDQKSYQKQLLHPFHNGDPVAEQVYEEQQHCQNAAVRIQSSVKALHFQRNRQEEMLLQEREDISVERKLREALSCRGCGHDTQISGKQGKGRHGRRQKGAARKDKAASEEILHAAVPMSKEPQHQEDADDKCDIEVTEQDVEHGKDVKHGAFLPEDPLHSENGQRQDHDTVQPHDIPAVADHVCIDGIAQSEGGDHHVVISSPSSSGQPVAEGAGGKGQLNDHQKCKYGENS